MIDTNDRYLRRITVGQSLTEKGHSREVLCNTHTHTHTHTQMYAVLMAYSALPITIVFFFRLNLTSLWEVRSWLS